MERRLAAILAADVVGYSRLMERDEAGTFARLRTHRKDLFEPEIAAHHGRVFKLMGDGLLAEFPSVVDAIACAVALQSGLAERNAAAPPEHRVEARIGVNLGDLIVETDDAGTADMHGEGVIIANRLQALAEPGGICVSQTVVSHVGHKLAVGFEFVGEQRVKNIAEPIRVYRVRTEPGAAGRTIGIRWPLRQKWRWPVAAAVLVVIAGAIAWQRPWQQRIEPALVQNMALPLPDKPSIAVLPFANMSDDPKQEYFADGITDDLITELSKVSSLFVISRNSTFVYKGRTVPAKQVSEELGVRYVLEGSVQRAGDQLRINAQLIDALDGGNRWADRFNGSLADVFALQDKVTASIADALALRLTASERRAINERETDLPAAYDAFLRGWEHFRRTTPEDYAKAIPYFEEAIELDPNYGRAYAALAMVYAHGSVRGWLGSLGLTAEEAFDKAKQYLQEARKQPTAMTHWVAGYILINGGAGAEALAEFREAAVLDPGDSWNYALIGFTLVSLGRSGEAIQYIDTAMRLDPRPPSLFMYYLGLSQFGMEQFDKAAASLESATKLNPDDQFPFLVLVASYGYLGRKQDAVTAIARYSDLAVKQGDVPVTIFDAPGLAFWPRIFWRVEDSRRLREGLLLAGMPMSILESEFGARNRLTFEEIHLLLLGHRVHGRDFWSGEERAASITTEGVVTLSGDWGTLDSVGGLLTGGILRFDTDELCYRFDFVSYCGTMFRNPGGTKANENEFFWYTSRGAMTFSQVDLAR